MEKIQIISNLMEVDILNVEHTTMSSLQIAELTGKKHQHVMRNIRIMLDELNLDESNFGRIYLDKYNREKPCYHLNEELTLTLTSGYSIVQRNAIIKEWLMLRGDPIRNMYLHFLKLEEIEKANGTAWGISGNEQKKFKKSLAKYREQIIGAFQQELDLFSELQQG